MVLCCFLDRINKIYGIRSEWHFLKHNHLPFKVQVEISRYTLPITCRYNFIPSPSWRPQSPLDAKRGWRNDSSDQREWQPGDTSTVPQASRLLHAQRVVIPGLGKSP